jgi:hypothetical protein
VPIYSWAFRVTSRYGARVSIITKLKSLTFVISHGQQRNEERDAPSSELRYISGLGIDGLGNLNEGTCWCRYVPPSLASLCPHAFSLIFQGSVTIPARTVTARRRVPYSSMWSAAVLPFSHRGAHQRCRNGDHVHRIGCPSYGFLAECQISCANVPFCGVRDRINRCENLLRLSVPFVAMILSGGSCIHMCMMSDMNSKSTPQA